ncbi:hypothetical protein HDE79_004276 [Rhodanobacter sp. MP1X3]|nr:hypothetical protein [Rhodanobacter sp. MP1X3]
MTYYSATVAVAQPAAQRNISLGYLRAFLIGVIWMQYALLQTHLPTIAKIVLVWAGAVGLSWGIAAMLRRVPAVSRIL